MTGAKALVILQFRNYTVEMISNRCHYALRAMLELTLRDGRGPVPTSEIAAAQNIPARFLEAIMRQLKQAGLVDSVRGKEGGYFLAQPASRIHVGTVLTLFDGPIFSDAEQLSPQVVRENEADVFVEVWRTAESALDTVFARYTFDVLLEREHQRRFALSANYVI